MNDLTEFEKEICVVFAKYYPSAISMVEDSFEELRSFDAVLSALNLSSKIGKSLSETTGFIIELKKIGQKAK